MHMFDFHSMPVATRMKKVSTIAALMFALALVFFSLNHATTGTYFYDDEQSLSGLRAVASFDDAAAYVLGGFAGPTGRPLSLASFLPYAPNWQSQIDRILRDNLMIHLLNTTLAFILLSRVIKKLQPDTNPITPVLLAFVWATLPINISTIFIPIQRMAALSLLFLLMGSISLMAGLENSNKNRSIAYQTFALFLFTPLSILSKETGFLAPIFYFLIEKFIFQKNQSKELKKTRYIYYTFFIGLLLFTLARPVFDASLYQTRTFTLVDRLVTQPYVVLEYIRLAILPRAFLFSPFHDNYKALSLENDAIQVFSGLIAIAIILITIVKTYRKARVVSFGLAWFIIGHTLESTTLPLELYFEHRNYGPSIGLMIALYGLLRLALSHKATTAAVIGYSLVIYAVSLQTASLWGDPDLSAEIWSIENPDSYRATVNLAISYQRQKATTPIVQKLFIASSEQCLDCAAPLVQASLISCESKQLVNAKELLMKSTHRIPFSRAEPATPALLNNIFRKVKTDECDDVTLADLEKINRMLLKNPRFMYWNSPGALIHFNLYNIAMANSDRTAALNHLRSAYEMEQSTDYAGLLMEHYFFNGSPNEAEQLVIGICDRKDILQRLISILGKDDCTYMRQWLDNVKNDRKGSI